VDHHQLLVEVEGGDVVRQLLLSEMLDHHHLEGAPEADPEAEADLHLEEELVARDDRALRIDEGLNTEKMSVCSRRNDTRKAREAV